MFLCIVTVLSRINRGIDGETPPSPYSGSYPYMSEKKPMIKIFADMFPTARYTGGNINPEINIDTSNTELNINARWCTPKHSITMKAVHLPTWCVLFTEATPQHEITQFHVELIRIILTIFC